MEIQFDEDFTPSHSRQSIQKDKTLTDWLLKHGIVKNETQAVAGMVLVSLVLITLSLVLVGKSLGIELNPLTEEVDTNNLDLYYHER